MPRPTAAQYAYGSATVVFSAVALLLLTGATGPAAVAVVGTLALGLGLAVAVAAPARRAAARRRPAPGSSAPAPAARAGEIAPRMPAPRAEARVGGHSLRR
ncbi:hypothetical protein ACFQ60_20635 [Streptomyces zhihengii]|uniref:Uncharacterized protein n=1 Tax=Streptomyces zhihengii TaxID=1818004 RepID=A0ABS2UV03_9ACTN|nr:hypothetical protein [Streptomyces zhihengii]MBM9621339.1 hypothetical protein [Streptomyces zhihengii]